VIISRITSLRRVPKHLAHEHLDQLLGKLPERNVGMSRVDHAADHGAELRADQLLEQRLLVGEVQIDRAFRHTGALGNVVEPRRRKAARGELIECRCQDGITALGGAFAPARLPERCGWRRANFAAMISKRCGSVPWPYMTDWSVII